MSDSAIADMTNYYTIVLWTMKCGQTTIKKKTIFMLVWMCVCVIVAEISINHIRQIQAKQQPTICHQVSLSILSFKHFIARKIVYGIFLI